MKTTKNKFPQYNIPAWLGREASKHECLDAMATGGGIDYIYRQLGETQAVIAGSDGCGSPDETDERSSVVFHSSADWNGPSVAVQFDNALTAIQFLVNLNGIEFINGPSGTYQASDQCQRCGHVHAPKEGCI